MTAPACARCGWLAIEAIVGPCEHCGGNTWNCQAPFSITLYEPAVTKVKPPETKDDATDLR